MSEMIKATNEELENAAGGAAFPGNWKTVAGLQKGYLAIRTAPTYDYGNEMRGYELYNGDAVQVLDTPVMGSDGKVYVRVYSPKSGVTGFVNANFLR
jgi:hypothetical protein